METRARIDRLALEPGKVLFVPGRQSTWAAYSRAFLDWRRFLVERNRLIIGQLKVFLCDSSHTGNCLIPSLSDVCAPPVSQLTDRFPTRSWTLVCFPCHSIILSRNRQPPVPFGPAARFTLIGIHFATKNDYFCNLKNYLTGFSCEKL